MLSMVLRSMLERVHTGLSAGMVIDTHIDNRTGVAHTHMSD
jgi:hypothetical protein